MRNRKTKIILALLIISGILVSLKLIPKSPGSNGEVVKEITPTLGSIQNIISTTGTVYPKNRLEIRPPVNGRVENVLVKEGDYVKAGTALALMSSTERAALLDAARGQGDELLKYWQEIYKAIQLISPIDGEVIVATTQPGQTVATSDAVIVLSDRLIVRAQVDETDIGKIRLGQDAIITLDAYPDTEIKATVDHIYYESETVNNVTIYKVDLLPKELPEFFRSGMNANIDFIVEDKKNVLTVPVGAVVKDNNEEYVLVKETNSYQPVKRPVKLGISDDKNAEVISGLTLKDTVVMISKKYSLPKKDNAGTNPFMPKPRSK